jgi:NADH:ubiquinone reductase (H+-translocating)
MYVTGAGMISGSGLQAPGRRRVVILGNGFAGFAAAQEFARRRLPSWAEVLVIDRRSYHLFTPLLYEAATGAIQIERLQYPVLPFYRRNGIKFHQGTVDAIDLERRQLRAGDRVLSYDFLMVSAGSRANFFGHPGFSAFTLPLKTASDAVRLRTHIESCIEQASHASRQDERNRLLTFAIVGGGPTGVELAAALHEARLHHLAGPAVQEPGSFRVMLIEAAPSILNTMAASVSQAALAELTRTGVLVRLGKAVEQADSGGLVLAGGERIHAATVVWSAGIHAIEIPGLTGETGPAGRLLVDHHLRLPDYPEVTIAGDIAAAPLEPRRRGTSAGWNGQFVPANAPAAIQMGTAAARNVTRGLLGLGPVAFRYRPEGDLIALGHRNAVAHLGGRTFTGLNAWLVRRGVYLAQLKGLKNRVGLAQDWWANERAAGRSAEDPRFSPAPGAEGETDLAADEISRAATAADDAALAELAALSGTGAAGDKDARG